MASAIVGFLQLVPPSHRRSYLPYLVVIAWHREDDVFVGESMSRGLDG